MSSSPAPRPCASIEEPPSSRPMRSASPNIVTPMTSAAPRQKVHAVKVLTSTICPTDRPAGLYSFSRAEPPGSSEKPGLWLQQKAPNQAIDDSSSETLRPERRREGKEEGSKR